MKTGDLDILILPGLGGGTENHWYHRWNGKLKTARIVEQSDWHKPDKDRWVETIVSAAKSTDRPVFIIAHGLGAIALAHAADQLSEANVVGAFLVAVPDLASAEHLIPEASQFQPLPNAPLPFPSLMVASRNDPYCISTMTVAMAPGRRASWHCQNSSTGFSSLGNFGKQRRCAACNDAGIHIQRKHAVTHRPGQL